MLADLSRWPEIDPEALRFRLGNMLEAIRLARAVPAGGVRIS
ncbi:MAG TPA: hypothetical protein VGB85_29330 [Nannocystis sp.]|jgi:hypothetical protein